MRTIILVIFLILPSFLRAQVADKDSIDLNLQYKNLKEVKRDWSLYKDYTSPFEERQSNRLLISSGTIIGASIVSFGILYALPETFTKWDKENMTFNTLTSDWWDNVKAGPVIDEDNLFLNWIMHPYFGGVYYMTARSAGHKWYTSAVHSALVSTFFWEYGIEAFAEIPSIQDLIITPVLGSVVGEAFFSAKKSIKRNNYYLLGSRWLGKFTLFLIDPLNEIQDCFVRRNLRKGVKSSAGQLHSFLSPNPQTGQLTINISINF
ncbi:MAG: DUF3943 domain-containing protein [Bacteroidales bacterium]